VLVVCTAVNVSCAAPVALDGFSGHFDRGRQAEVYDGWGLVRLPLQCCVCTSWDYYLFNASALTAVRLLNTIAPATFEPATGNVYSVSNPYGQGVFVFDSFNLGSHGTTSSSFSEDLMRIGAGAGGNSSGLSTTSTVLAVVAAVVCVLACAIVAVYARRRQRGRATSGAASAVAEVVTETKEAL